MGMALTADSVLAQAEQACAAGECEQTISLLEKAATLRTCDLRLYYWLGLCYGGGCRPHSLAHPDMAAAWLRQALRLAPAGAISLAGARAAVLDQLAHALLHSTGTPRKEALDAAIECHREAAEIYRAAGMMEDWARAQFNLGNSLCEISEMAGEDHWREAIAHYELCLQVRTREKDPERWAAVLENLGTAYRRLPPPETGRGIRTSIGYYRRALAVYTPSAYPDRNAALQNNLGNAFLALAEAGDPAALRHARRALGHFERALRLQSRDPRSRAFGITQYNRAQAYFRLARNGQAAACLEAAAAAFEACGEPRYRDLVRRQQRDQRCAVPS